MFNSEKVLNLVTVVLYLLIANFVLQSCTFCVEKEILNNLSSIFPDLEIESNVFLGTKNKEISIQDCSRSNQMCCTNSVLEYFNIFMRQVLHDMSGLKDINELVIGLTNNFKSILLTVINTFIYNIHLSIEKLNFKHLEFNVTNFYHHFYMELRLKLIDERHRINLTSIILGNSINKDIIKIDNFTSYFNDATERNLLMFYRFSSVLSSIIQQIQDIPLSKSCKRDLLQMTICGICSQNLDYTLYHSENKTHFNNKICPKYCHNVIKNCLAYYSVLIEPLKSLQFAFNSFINNHTSNIENYSQFWFKNSVEDFSILKLILNYSKKIEVPKLDEDKHLEDDQDLEAARYFFKCIKSGKCKFSNEKYYTQFNEEIHELTKTLKGYIETYVKPDSFINNFLAKKCDYSNFSLCWNGFENGQYHNEIQKFPPWVGEETKVLENIPSDQKSYLQNLLIIIKNYSRILNQKFSNSKENDISHFEGSGKINDYQPDDEDYDKNNFSPSSVKPSIHLVTIPNNISMEDLININLPVSNTSAIILPISENNNSCRIHILNILLPIYFIFILNYQIF